MLGIINGSILKFQSQVKVPSAGSAFATLRFTDTISKGLAYTQLPATVVEYKDADAAPYTPIKDADISYVDPLLTIDITNGAITNPAKDVLVRVTFYVTVTDVTQAINVGGNITNTATFTMLNASGDPIGTAATATVNQPMNVYDLSVVGIPVTIQKAADQTFNAVYTFATMNGEGQQNLKYKLVIYPNVNCTFNPGIDPDYAAVTTTLNSLDGTVVDRTVTVTPDAITIEIPHTDAINGDIIYVKIPAKSAATIVDVEAPQFIFGDADLLNDAKVVQSANNYNVQVNFTGEIKVLTDVTKELILS